jgi:hypothetical protein
MAEWELSDGVGQVGPLDEDQVIRMLQHGVPTQTVVRAVGETEWRSPRSHAPFAIAIEQAKARAAYADFSEPLQTPAPQQPPSAHYPAPAPPATSRLDRDPWWDASASVQKSRVSRHLPAVLGSCGGLFALTLLLFFVYSPPSKPRGAPDYKLPGIVPTPTASASPVRQTAVDLAAERAELADAGTTRREEMVRWCATNPEQCDEARLENMIGSGTTDKERAKLRSVASPIVAAAQREREQQLALSAAGSLQSIVRRAKDGPELYEATGAVAALLDATVGPKVLDALPKTSLAEAAKDPDSARGSVIRASGTVIEIRKVTGTLFQGSLASDDGAHIVYFVTSMPTTGVYANSWAVFRGAFVQEYDYANVSGGETRSLLLVGGFQH